MKKAISCLICAAMMLTAFLPATAFAANTDFIPHPSTTYASTFINKCEDQQWFINEVERLLNAEQKTLDSITSASDLDVIKAIGLESKGISGKIPSAIGELKELRYLFLSGNALGGAIPAELYTLPKLQNIDLSGNNYTGNIPAAFGTMPSLDTLMLADNGYSGTIPSSILHNTTIKVLDLHSNQLSGGIPADLSGMTGLTYISLAGNTLNGSIPDLSALTKLIALDLGGCDVTGSIPESLYSLTKLQILNLGGNKLTGELSDGLCNLTAVQCLVLNNNQLRGTIPSDFAPDMTGNATPVIHLENNYLRGTIPVKLANAMASGASVYLDNNYMGGTEVANSSSSAGDFTDGASGQYQLSAKQTLVQISQTGTTNLYSQLENKALFSTNENKPLLKANEYSVSYDTTKVDVTVTDNGILVKALVEIPRAEAVPVTISILGNEGVAHSTAVINVTTNEVNGGGTGGGGGGSSSSSTYYTITTKDDSVKFDKERAKAGETVTLTVSPNETGTYLPPIVQTINGKDVSVENCGNGTFTFIMPAFNVKVNPAPNAVTECCKDDSCPIYPFSDAKPTDWYHDGVHYCLENGYMKGMKATVFAPGRTTSRAMIVTILYRLEGEPAVSGDAGYIDLTQDWYKDAIQWGTECGIVNGYGKGKFGPNDSITREQLATILFRFADYKKYDISVRNDISFYQDANEISGWALDGIEWANANLPMTGRTNTTLVPKGTATRAESATLIYRFCENIEK